MNRSCVRLLTALLLIFGLVVTAFPLPSLAETIARCGEGWLERVDGYFVLHLKGSPYEMGYQHGALLRDHCRENLHFLLYEKGDMEVELGPIRVRPRVAIDGIVAIQKKHVPPKYFSELEGLAAGAELQTKDVYAGNFIPEMFHCSGFALMNSTTRDGTLYHGRVLDYACDWRLQDHAVLIVAEPEGEIPFVNVTYAGFIGSVSGMNSRHVSIGEMGGGGLGHWEGVPMALLVREVLQTADDLREAVDVFRSNPRTCEYYYIVADGKSNSAVGLATTWEKMEVIGPGESHPRLPHAVQDAVLLSAGDRYEKLVERVRAGQGGFDDQAAIRLMDRPVAMKSNLHNVLFEPKATRFWVSNAGKEGQPAAEQPYHAFQLSELLERSPDKEAPVVPLRPPVATAASTGAP
jgi:hypothetical protein